MSLNRESNGRFTHQWGWQGFDATGDEWAACQHCAKWRCTRTGQITKRAPGELRASSADWRSE